MQRDDDSGAGQRQLYDAMIRPEQQEYMSTNRNQTYAGLGARTAGSSTYGTGPPLGTASGIRPPRLPGADGTLSSVSTQPTDSRTVSSIGSSVPHGRTLPLREPGETDNLIPTDEDEIINPHALRLAREVRALENNAESSDDSDSRDHPYFDYDDSAKNAQPGAPRTNYSL